jgi:transposase, IS30 family
VCRDEWPARFWGAPAQKCVGATRLLLGGGRHSAIATLVERKARHTILVPIRGSYSAQRVGDALIAVFSTLPSPLRRTLTWDQGNEMFHHERIEKATGTKIYFADPHSPWQRGTNETPTACCGSTSPRA